VRGIDRGVGMRKGVWMKYGLQKADIRVPREKHFLEHFYTQKRGFQGIYRVVLLFYNELRDFLVFL